MVGPVIVLLAERVNPCSGLGSPVRLCYGPDMAADAPRPFHLRDNFAPVEREETAFDLPVEGELPRSLRGLYVRNGPNPRGGVSSHWFAGDGMVHGVRLEAGRCAWYRNRWVRTRILTEGAPLVRADFTVDHTVGVANTHVVDHAGRLFALVESSFPTELDRELGTIGPCDFDGRLTTSMTAHPKRCPKTGELHFFGYRFFAPWLTYHRLDAAGRLVRSEEITVPGPTMIHDFALTERHVVFMDLPIVFSVERAMAGTGFPYEWSDEYGARVGVMPRDGGDRDVRWLDVEPCYVFHPMNAHDTEDGVVLDVVRYSELWRGGPDTFSPANLHRWTINLRAGRVVETPLDDRPIEFPRIDERRTAAANRFGYAVANRGDVSQLATAVVKYDLARGTAVAHEFGAGRHPSEAVFVPARETAAEDEGVLLCFVWDAARDGSDLVVLDAHSPSDAPLATVRLPQRVPFGFHGSWVVD
jgi:carotenoid cleavage dioxygenase